VVGLRLIVFIIFLPINLVTGNFFTFSQSNLGDPHLVLELGVAVARLSCFILFLTGYAIRHEVVIIEDVLLVHVSLKY
jgi:hypothetical protein